MNLIGQSCRVTRMRPTVTGPPADLTEGQVHEGRVKLSSWFCLLGAVAGGRAPPQGGVGGATLTPEAASWSVRSG